MKEMPTQQLPADSEWLYVPDKDEWVVHKKSGNVALSKKEASLNILARLEQIKDNILKNAVQKQDVVDFYLLSLLPPEYLNKTAIGPEHINGLTLYQGVIQTLRDEYVRRGMEELKDEAETTKWDHGIPDEEMSEKLKPYYTEHDSGWSPNFAYDEENDSEYQCSDCGSGIDEIEATFFNDEYYCPDCYDKAVTKALEEDVVYCKTHNVFLVDSASKVLDKELADALQGLGYKTSDDEKHFDESEDNLLQYTEGQKAWEEVKENLKKQLQLPFRERAKKSVLKKSLNKKAERGGPWWEAPTNFEDYTSTDFYNVFEYAPWQDMYGGPAWAEIAKTINQMENTTDWQKLALLIDHFHDLGHNTGKLLDKFPEWSKWFKNLLDLKASRDAVRRLIPMASPEVRNLVQEYYAVQRGGEDWRKVNYPATDFSKSDLNAIIRDDQVPAEVLFNAAKYSTDVGDPYTVVNLIQHKNMDKNTLKKIMSYIESNKNSVPSYFIPHVNETLENLGLIEKPKTEPAQPTKFTWNAGDTAFYGDFPVIIVSLGDGLTYQVQFQDGSTHWVSKEDLAKQKLPAAANKKVQLNKLSKKGYGEEAICPTCGEWKPTDFSPEQLKEMDWECLDCMNKRLTNPQDLPENRGQKEITKFDPEYEWFMRLINTVIKAGVPAKEIKELSLRHPFVTIDDVGDLAAQIWTLATEKYGIPREWLRKKLPERKANLKQAYEGGYPTENDAVYWGTAPVNTYSDQPMINHDAPTGLREGDTGEPIVICPKCKSDKINIESSPAKCLVCGTNFSPKPDRGSDDPAVNDYSQNYFWGPNDLGRSHQNQPGANGWLPAGTEDMDGPSSNVMMSSFKSFMHKTSSLNKVAHCGPCSVLKMEALHILIDLYYKDNSLFPEEIIEELSVAATELKLDNFNDILESVTEEYLEEKAEKVGDKLPKLKNLLIALKDIAPKLGKEIEVVDKQESVAKQAAQEEYPKISKPKSGYVDNGTGYTCGRCEYFNPEREKCKKVEGTIKSFGCCNFWDGKGKFKEKNKTAEKKALETDKRALTKEEAVYVEYPNVDYRCDECAFFNAEAKKCTKVDGEISPTASCNFWQPIKNKQANLKQAFTTVKRVLILCSGNTCRSPMAENILRSIRPDLEVISRGIYVGSAKQPMTPEALEALKEKGIPVQPHTAQQVTKKDIEWADLILTMTEWIKEDLVKLFPQASNKTFLLGETDIGDPIGGKAEDYKKIRDEIAQALSKMGSLNKQANPPSRFWITPDGKEFPVFSAGHGKWIEQNPKILRQYGIDIKTFGIPSDITMEMYNTGWVRVSNEPAGTGFQIQIFNLRNIPKTVDNLIAKYFKPGDTILIGDGVGKGIEVTDPFPSIQKAVNKELSRTKQASLFDEVLDQTTQDAIAAEYGPQMLIAMRFYNDAMRYGQAHDRALAYALEETKRMKRPVDQKSFLDVLNTYF